MCLYSGPKITEAPQKNLACHGWSQCWARATFFQFAPPQRAPLFKSSHHRVIVSAKTFQTLMFACLSLKDFQTPMFVLLRFPNFIVCCSKVSRHLCLSFLGFKAPKFFFTVRLQNSNLSHSDVCRSGVSKLQCLSFQGLKLQCLPLPGFQTTMFVFLRFPSSPRFQTLMFVTLQ